MEGIGGREGGEEGLRRVQKRRLGCCERNPSSCVLWIPEKVLELANGRADAGYIRTRAGDDYEG